MNQVDFFLSKLFVPSEGVVFGVADVLLAMAVTTLLCFMLAHVYRATHRGTSYSQSFLVTIFLVAVATSIVMMIIGSNIARAFSLVGALSIIRFRTAVKDPRDTGFIFAGIVVGMGCGTGFYMPVIAMTVFICLLALALFHFDFGVKQQLESIVKVSFSGGDTSQQAIEAELERSFHQVKRINRILDFGDDEVTNVYVVKPRQDTEVAGVEERLGSMEHVARFAIYETDQHAPV